MFEMVSIHVTVSIPSKMDSSPFFTTTTTPSFDSIFNVNHGQVLQPEILKDRHISGTKRQCSGFRLGVTICRYSWSDRRGIIPWERKRNARLETCVSKWRKQRRKRGDTGLRFVWESSWGFVQCSSVFFVWLTWGFHVQIIWDIASIKTVLVVAGSCWCYFFLIPWRNISDGSNMWREWWDIGSNHSRITTVLFPLGTISQWC